MEEGAEEEEEGEESTLQKAQTLILVEAAQDVCSVTPFLLEVEAVG